MVSEVSVRRYPWPDGGDPSVYLELIEENVYKFLYKKKAIQNTLTVVGWNNIQLNIYVIKIKA